MSKELEGNCLIAQSGGPTSVINSSLAGIVSEALNYECIEEIYGALNGVLGILNEEFIDLAAESQQNIRGLRYTPASALGSCRYKLKKQPDFDRVLEVFEAHNIRYFFYIGGNDSQDTANKISKLAQQKGYELRVIGVPKTIDNDLVLTDHCPGYGSAIKHLSSLVRELSCDHQSMGMHDYVSIVEVMGRNSGWIAAGSSLAKNKGSNQDAPHIILLPEVAFNEDKFLQDVQQVLKKNRFCMIVASEGIVDEDGNYVAKSNDKTDSFGHPALGGAGEFLRSLVEDALGISARSCKLGISQRACATNSSQVDNDESYQSGVSAVEAAMNGETDKCVILVRGENDPYSCETSLVALEEIANGEKKIPENWISEDGISMNLQFIKYAQPLIQGEVEVPFEFGVPNFVKLSMKKARRKLEPYTAV
jgi:6-phosphofructokinase 1|tara:strand:+ start:4199 stop:5461 length:1263 start_codon:yes stop_codon:yes gene_type:complete